MANDYQIRTKKGYDFFEVASAFQKAIRRCDEKQAMYWAIELYESNYAKYAWKRMLIMSCEDVGLGSPFTNQVVWNLYQTYEWLVALKEHSRPELLPFTQAVLHLAHCHKSRYIDIAVTVYWAQHEREHLPIPDYAYDEHTKVGRMKGRGRAHFWNEAALINNPRLVENEEEMRKIAYEVGGEHSKPLKENISCTDKEASEMAQLTLFDEF